MARSHSPWGKNTRQRVALEAARIMSEEHISDFSKAKRKAADRLGITTRNDMPTNQEIDFELRAYRSIFDDQNANENLLSQRNAAVEAMKFFDKFRPRLVGAVLDGTANIHEPVQLHLFSDLPDDVVFFLMEKGIEFDQDEKNFRYKSGKTQNVPCICFHAGDIAVELMIFSAIDIRQAPLSHVNGQIMKRADIETVKSLITAS
jgi:hypothetical protein